MLDAILFLHKYSECRLINHHFTRTFKSSSKQSNMKNDQLRAELKAMGTANTGLHAEIQSLCNIPNDTKAENKTLRWQNGVLCKDLNKLQKNWEKTGSVRG